MNNKKIEMEFHKKMLKKKRKKETKEKNNISTDN